MLGAQAAGSWPAALACWFTGGHAPDRPLAEAPDGISHRPRHRPRVRATAPVGSGKPARPSPRGPARKRPARRALPAARPGAALRARGGRRGGRGGDREVRPLSLGPPRARAARRPAHAEGAAAIAFDMSLSDEDLGAQFAGAKRFYKRFEEISLAGPDGSAAVARFGNADANVAGAASALQALRAELKPGGDAVS